MSDQHDEPDVSNESEDAGSTSQDFGNLSVEDDAQGTVDPADLAGTAGADDDGGPESSNGSDNDLS